MKIKLYRAIHKLGEKGEVVNVTSEIGNRLVCQGRAAVISHDCPPTDAMVSKLIAPPPEEPEPVKVVLVGDSNDAPEQETETNKQSADKSSNPKRKQKRTEKS